MKRLLAVGLSLAVLFSMAGCKQKESSGTEEESAEKQKITVGCLARDEAAVQWIAEQLADKYDIEAQVYSETVSIMQAAADGANDLNFLANIPYLESYNNNYGSDLIYYKDQLTTSPTYIISQKYKSLEEIPDKALMAVANDNANRTRELKVLVSEGIIKIDDKAENPTVLDITDNSKQLSFNEIDARSRVGALPDYDAVTMPAMTFFQMDQKDKDACNILARESDQASVDVSGQGLCCLKENADKEWMEDIWKVGCTKEFGDWLIETYEGALIPSGYLLQSGEVKYENPTFKVPDIY